MIMRVCFFSLNLQGGGAERQLLQLARYWQRGNGHLGVVLLERQGAWLRELPSNVPCYVLTARMPSNPLAKILWALCLIPRLQGFFQQNPYDAVLTFLWLPTVLSAIVLPWLPNPPLLVWSVQSDLEQDLTLHWEGWLRRWLVCTFLPRRVNHFIAVSEGIRRKTQVFLDITADRFTVIPNSIELSYIMRMASVSSNIATKEESVRLISIGRLHPQKGIDILLHALAQINHQLEWKCYILGEGPERSRLTKLTKLLGLDEHVSFAGFVSNPYAWLRTADIFVLASRWEPFGIAIVEAMALGLPVVATATDGALDIIEDGVDGILVPVGDTSALADAITELICNPSLRQRLGEKAKQKARQFDTSLIAQQYMELLEQLLEEAKRS